VQIRLLVVGRGGRELRDFEARFVERLHTFARFQIIELPEGRGKQVNQRKQAEAKQILKQVRTPFILFDERGTLNSSMQWSAHLQQQRGDAQLDFVIGGANGVDETVRRAASAIWSLSKLTLPHQLARALVVEQLYRAFTIIQGHPYHRA